VELPSLALADEIARIALASLSQPAKGDAIGAGSRLNMPTDPTWYTEKAKFEDGHEIGAGRRTVTINPTAEEIAEMERLQFEALPKWARDEITKLRAAIGAGGQAVAVKALPSEDELVATFKAAVDTDGEPLQMSFKGWDKAKGYRFLARAVLSSIAHPAPSRQAVVEAQSIAEIIDPHSFMDIPFTDDPVLLDMVEQSKQDAIRKAERILSSLSNPPARPGWRLIERGETIEADDEVITDDAVSWVKVDRWAVGAHYSGIFKSIRRATPAAPLPGGAE
jgi:hypothetical protein